MRGVDRVDAAGWPGRGRPAAPDRRAPRLRSNPPVPRAGPGGRASAERTARAGGTIARHGAERIGRAPGRLLPCRRSRTGFGRRHGHARRCEQPRLADGVAFALGPSGPRLSNQTAAKTPRRPAEPPGPVRIAVHWFYWPARPDVAAMQRLCERALRRDECDDDEFSDSADRDTFVRLAHSSNAPLIGSAHAGVGRARFAYLDPGTLAAASEAHMNWEAGFGIGRYTPGLGYVAVEYEHQERFHAGETTDFCQTVSTSALECRTVVVGRPTGRRLEIGGIEWRLFASGGRLAMNPSASRDFRGRVWARSIFLSTSSRCRLRDWLAAPGRAGEATPGTSRSRFSSGRRSVRRREVRLKPDATYGAGRPRARPDAV